MSPITLICGVGNEQGMGAARQRLVEFGNLSADIQIVGDEFVGAIQRDHRRHTDAGVV